MLTVMYVGAQFWGYINLGQCCIPYIGLFAALIFTAFVGHMCFLFPSLLHPMRIVFDSAFLLQSSCSMSQLCL